MPKIDAPTVAEHRSQVQKQLVDAAERILRVGADRLTASAVSRQAGIARNSIYRYVDSVDDLRAMVLHRHLPAWQAAVETALENVEDPEARIMTWARANMEQAAASGHGWLMALACSAPLGDATEEAVRGAHADLRDTVSQAWGRLCADPDRAAVAVQLTRGLVDAGFRTLDTGIEADLVTSATQAAVGAVIVELADHGQ